MSDASTTHAPTPDPARASRPSEEPHAEGNLEKIRDLLFGREMSTIETRFLRLEARMEAQAADLRADISARMDALEAHVRSELSSLSATITQERRERIDALDRATADASGGRATLARMIREQKEEHDLTAQAVRQQILDEAATAQNALRTTTDEIRRTMAHHAGLLQTRKADRASLAAIFSEAASRLEDGT
ncbi:hypothetical protein [Rubricoccus marinus]|uniref:Uncharacterized protein n=1 Tax=Rubricoccus marinus TaxID=716817 RepID=A0A259U1F5_9BACT|nr:hypothetical protein [Rubricoccus marinus]OZC03863.1 hypothetical protein BSZ36_13235 [Rubricoccus marinus]